MRDEAAIPDEARIGYGRFGVGKIAVIDDACLQALHGPAGDQVVDVPSDAQGGEDDSGSAGPDNRAYPGGHRCRQLRIGARDPATGSIEAERGVDRPSPSARRSGRGLADPAEQGIAQSEVDHRRAEVGKDGDIFRPPLLEQGLGIGAVDPQVPAGGQRPGRGGSLGEHGYHGDGATASEVGEEGATGQHNIIKVRRNRHDGPGSATELMHQPDQPIRHQPVTSPAPGIPRPRRYQPQASNGEVVPMSRVVITCHCHEANPRCPAGSAILVREIARCVSRRHEVLVISGSFPGCRQACSEPFQQYHLPAGHGWPLAEHLQFQLLLAKAAPRIPHDLWIDSVPPIPARIIPRAGSESAIALLHIPMAEEKIRWREGLLRPCRLRGLGGYHRFIVPDEADRQAVARGRRDVSCAVIPNGIDLPDQPSVPGEGSHILFIGRIDVDRKGLDLLLNAVALAEPTLPVLIAGAGSPAEEGKLARLIERTRGPVARVGHVCGPAKEALLRGSAFMVLPSRREAFGRSALEAMAWGKPVVHFDLPRLRWMGYQAAIGVPAFDTASLAAAIRVLAADDVRRASMGRAARKVAEQYSWARVGDRYLEIADRSIKEQSGADLPRTAN